MAQARPAGRGGFTAVHVWMISFVFLWLTAMILLVWLYTDQEGLNSNLNELRSRNDQLTRSNNEVEAQRMETAVLAVGEETQDVDEVRARIRALFDTISSDGLVEDPSVFSTLELLPAMSVLYQDFRGERDRGSAAEERAQSVESEHEELIAAYAELKEKFDNATNDLKGRVDDIESSRATYAAQRDQEVDDFDRKMDELRQQYSRDLQEQRNALEAAAQRRKELESRYAELQAKVGEQQIKPGEQLTARTADGKVVLAMPGDDVVSISLGRQHQLTTGLQFAVYPSSGIPIDGRSKGRIEVTRIHQRTAECEIVSLDSMEVIVEGDLIANPVYDPGRPLRFVVVGEFDLDRDGRDDTQGAEQIEGLIRAWGGDVLGNLSSRADFVVAGYAPVVPETVSMDKSRRDPGAVENERLQKARLEEYNGILASALELSIPVLTQDVFLRFLGY
ncbi:MAG: hypothetical protein V3W34_18095 [Phycisphaerae bacterium]